jgi:hypothetical protein
MILKISSPFISSPINYICNKMLRGGVFSDRLKYALIKPLHKNGDICDVTNYRPISLLTSFSKIFETIIYSRTLDHLNRYNIRSTEQYRFRKGLKTDSAIYKLNTEILNAMNNKQTVYYIITDVVYYYIAILLILYHYIIIIIIISLLYYYTIILILCINL